MPIYTVYMMHKMRSTQIVRANNEEEAKAKAYKQSFELQDNGESTWEEHDTDYYSIDRANEDEGERFEGYLYEGDDD